MTKVLTFISLFTLSGLHFSFDRIDLSALDNSSTSSYAADKLWHGKKAAVILTYDDALDVQLDNVVPALDSLGFKGSFYLTADFAGSKNRIQDWRKAAANGHELGNHTLFHPCDASKPGRSWVSPSNDLSKYNTEQIVREIDMTNVFLEAIDGKKERTFAYTCGDTQSGEGSFIEKIKGQFVSMRGVRGQINKLETLDLSNIDCFVIDNNNANQLVTWAEKAKDEHGMMVVLFHGVGGGHSINTDLKKHNDFLKYLKKHPDDFWVTTLLDASKHCIQQSKK
jgi:sialate O-acetylesterase